MTTMTSLSYSSKTLTAFFLLTSQQANKSTERQTPEPQTRPTKSRNIPEMSHKALFHYHRWMSHTVCLLGRREEHWGGESPSFSGSKNHVCALRAVEAIFWVGSSNHAVCSSRSKADQNESSMKGGKHGESQGERWCRRRGTHTVPLQFNQSISVATKKMHRKDEFKTKNYTAWT